jgi:hypothetical protein
MTIQYTDNGKTKRIRSLAKSLALVWALWWIFFGVAYAVGQKFSQQAVLVLLVFPLLFLGSAMLPRFSERTGGIVLLLEGLMILIGYPWFTYGRVPLFAIVAVLFMLALPPLISGVLLLAAGRRKPGAPEVSHESP